MATLTPSAKQQFFDANGNPLAGGKLYTYAAGTTTPLATYTDSSGGTPNTNPIILDSRGEANIWLGSAVYKFKLTTSTDVELWTVDNVQTDYADALADLAASGGSSLVGFLQSGTSATARTVQSKLRDFVSVKDFGAVGDGITNDTAAIQAAAIYCKTNKKTLHFPAGTYLLTPNQVDVGGIETFGDGANTILRSTGAAGAILKAEGNPASVYAGFINDTYIHDIQLDGTTNSVNTIGLSLIAQINCRVENIYVRRLNIAFNESALIRCSYNNVRDVTVSFTNAERCNYIVYNNSGYRTADIDFTNSQVMANLYHIYLKGTASAYIDGYNIIGNTFFVDPDDAGYAHVNCVYVEYGANWSNIAENKFFESGSSAVSLINCPHVNVSNNQIASAGRLGSLANGNCAGIRVASDSASFNQILSTNIIVNNNIFVDCRAEAIWASSTANLEVSNNLVSQPSKTRSSFTYSSIVLISCTEPKIFNNSVSAYNTSNACFCFNTWDVEISSCRNPQIVHEPAFRVYGDDSQIDKDFYAGGIVARSHNQLAADGNTFTNWSAGAFSGLVSAATITPNAVTAPNGVATSAAQLNFGATTPISDQWDSYVQYNITTSVTTSSQYVFSVYLRSASPTVIAMSILTNDATRSIVNVPVDTNWRRVWIRHTGMDSAATLSVRIWNTPNSGAKTIFAWGANVTASNELFPMSFTQPHGTAARLIVQRTSSNFGRVEYFGAGTPSSNYSIVGDRIINIAPTVGQPKAWSCTVSGAPGTWVSEGNL